MADAVRIGDDVGYSLCLQAKMASRDHVLAITLDFDDPPLVDGRD
ncbi:hypothetical protein NUH86_24260 (plasmid) [Sphingobium sp. JS3065]|nr:hypothetical protein [Sphingobium sp. JS3065]UZW58300.1 hypothetical protein NUH86_24260 [Sphingobium sp. JS3065]